MFTQFASVTGSPITSSRLLHCSKVSAISHYFSFFLKVYWKLKASPNISFALRSSRLQLFYRPLVLKIFWHFQEWGWKISIFPEKSGVKSSYVLISLMRSRGESPGRLSYTTLWKALNSLCNSWLLTKEYISIY